MIQLKIFDIDPDIINKINFKLMTHSLSLLTKNKRAKVVSAINYVLIRLDNISFSEKLKKFYILDNSETYMLDDLQQIEERQYSLSLEKLKEYFITELKQEMQLLFTKAMITNIAKRVLKYYRFYVKQTRIRERLEYVDNYYITMFKNVFYEADIVDEFITIKEAL